MKQNLFIAYVGLNLKVIRLGALTSFSEFNSGLVIKITRPWACPEHVVTGVSDHKNVKTHEITLNKLKMTTLYQNTLSLATA